MNEKLISELSNVQKKLYTYHKIYPNDPAYNLSFCYKIVGEFNVQKFKSVMELVINGNEIFKTHIVEKEGKPVQVYESSREYDVEIVNLPEEYTENDCDVHVGEYISKQNINCIDISKWPLYDIKIFSSSQNIYYLTINADHIIADGYSYFNFLNDIMALYNDNKESDVYSVENHKTLYFDFANYKSSPIRTQKAIDYFQEEFKAFDGLELKEINKSRNENGIISGKSTKFSLNEDVSSEIQSYLKKHNFTDFSFFAAIYCVLLYKLTRQNRIVVGIPIANRPKKEFKNIVGYFVNTLPLTVDFEKVTTFEELCSVIKKKVISLIRYQDFDLNLHAPAIFAKQSLPLDSFNNAFTFYKQPLSFELKNCIVTPMPLQIQNLKFAFTCNVENYDSFYVVNAEYNSFFDQIPIKDVYDNIINQIINSENSNIGALSLLNDQLTKAICINCNERKFNAEDTIIDIFESKAKQFPNQIAVSCDQEEWTYEYLNIKSNQIAHYLNLSLSEDIKMVAVSLERSNLLIATILGVLKSGRTYVPIDVSCPQERMEYILNDLNNTALITTKLFKDKVCNQSIDKLIIEEILLTIDEYPMYNLMPTYDNSSVAYIIYTSGSTGNPKGVMVTHKNVVRLFLATDSKFQFNETDCWALFHSYGFDFSVWEIFGALLYGGKLIIVPEWITKVPDEFYKLMLKEKVTVLNQTPSYFKHLIKEDSEYKGSEKLCLRYIIFGGETLYFEMLRPWFDKYGDKYPKVINMYGITETTVHVTYYEVLMNDLNNKAGSIIGKPIPDLNVYIVNNDMQVQPIGVPGEIVIGGEGVTKGYYNKKSLTEERFVEKSIYPNRKEFLYRSGDLGKILPNGQIEYLGRIDKQVQLRGYRIELGEIETVINQHPSYQDCVVDVHEFSDDDKRLVAYVVVKPNSSHVLYELKEYLKGRLPEYMVPSLFMVIDKKPLTVNGKVNYKALPQPIINQVSVPIPKMEDKVELDILQIWKDVLKIENIGLEDNFFDVGGTSLHVAEIYYKLVEKFNISNFSMVDLFEYTNVKELSIYIKQNSHLEENTKKNNRGLKRKEALLNRKLK
ncbi:non-ribosomal peptide synthetase [Bacillus cereus]|uniref:non-ribosomal peptide synthetase n=1 Tax=Bacillus cereus TaxID=1396 RepID=UPI00384F4615